ncbi:MAG TPA: hypothetical protein ENI23_06795 [bacterium]|nr:hypothetical protein [bacterium]
MAAFIPWKVIAFVTIICFTLLNLAIYSRTDPDALIINETELKNLLQSNNLLLNKDINVRKELKEEIKKYEFREEAANCPTP